MADIQSNINVNINTSEALANVRTLQRQISAFYESMARSGAAASAAASNMQNNLINTINQTGKFSASIKNITSTTEAFTTSLEKNKLSMGQYFKFAGGASKTFGKFFKTEMDTIDKVARERVKTLQTQYIRLGRDASGALKSIAVRPLALDMENLGTKTAIAAQKQQLLNQLLKQGSTNLLNFGKNTQWAGRQLMVGFTIPLSMVGTAAAKTFMQMEEQAIKFKRVYGDSMTPTDETNAMVQQVRDLASEFTKYGVAAEKTMELAASAAAAGKQGTELTAQVREANRLAVLGQVEQQDALNTTISITNAFGTAASELASKIDFLNAVENQTVTSIEDLTIAVPKAGPVIQQLGGDVEDLAFFLTAMKEGGINASEGANALKSGLASLINPTAKASDFLAGFGINIKQIVEANKGDVKGLVVDFASALDTLDPLNRARAIEQMFGKFQFARLSTLFQNVIGEGTQAARVLDLTGKSASELAALSSKELGTVAASSMFKFQKAVEDLKVALAPVGEIFLKLVTPVIEFGTKILENFNKLDSGAKNFILGLTAVIGGLGPILIMTFGLLANGVANIIKGFTLVRKIFGQSGDASKFLGDQTDYMTQQQLEAAGVAASLEQVHERLEQRFTSEAGAVDRLTQALQRANTANLTFQGRNTGKVTMPKKYAKGVVSVPGPKGAGDIVPAMLAPGEAVVPAKQATKYAALIQGIVADNIPGYRKSNVDIGPMPSGGSQAQKYKSQFAHVNETVVEITAQEMVKIIDKVQEAGGKVSVKLEKLVRAIATDLDPNTVLRSYSGLGFKQKASLNTQMRQGGAVSTEEFLQDFTLQGSKKWNQSIKFGGGNLKNAELQAHLAEYDAQIIKLVQEFKDLSGGATITSEQFTKIESEARKTLPEFSELRVALNNAEKGFYDLRANLNEEMFKNKGIVLTQVEGSSTKSARSPSNNSYLRTRGNRAYGNTLIEGVTLETLKSVGNVQTGVQQGLNAAIQRNSPPKTAIQIGKDYGFALNGALREMIPKVRVAGASFGVAATTSMTTITPAMQQHLRDSAIRIVRPFVDAQGNVSTQSQRRTRELNAEAAATRKAADADRMRSVVLQGQALTAMGGSLLPGFGLGSSDDPSKDKKSGGFAKFSGVVRNTSFALTSLAAAGTMAGGVVGDVSNNIMQLSGVVFALTTIMDLLSAVTKKEIAAKILSSKIGQGLMFSRGAAGGAKFGASMKNAIAPLSGAFSGGGLRGILSGMKTLGTVALTAGRALLSFVPVVGWIAAGLTAVWLVSKLVADAKEKERLATEGVADAMISTTKELNSIGDVLGKDKIKSAVEKIGTGGPASQEEMGTVEKLRGSQQFKDTYKSDIEAMRTMSQRELQSYQNTLALSLQATGQYTQDEIEGVIKALQLEAGRTDVKLKFESIDITSKDPAVFKKSLERFAKNAQTSTQSTLNPNQAKEAGNIAVAGYYETFNSVNTALQNGVIGLEAYTTKMNDLKASLKGLGETTQTTIVQGMMDRLTTAIKETQPEFAAMASGVKGASNQLFLMEAITSGAIGDITELARVVKALNILTNETDVNSAVWKAANVVIEEYKVKVATATKTTASFADAQQTAAETTKSAFQSAAEELTNNIKGVRESIKAYSLLSKAGLSAADAFTLAQNPALATALATTKVGTAKWKQLVSLAKEFVAVTKGKTLADSLSKLASEQQLLTKFGKLSKYLSQMGMSTEDISSVLQDEDLANSLVYATGEGKKGFEQIDKFIKTKLSNIKLKMNIFPEEYVKEQVQKANDAFSAKENLLNVKFRISTKADQDLIRATQAKIDNLNFQADDYEAGLTRLEDGEAAINEKYDNRLEALDKIIAANDRIADQNKEELNIFQMVSRGDIAGAAAGIAQLQQQKAKNALEAKKEALQAQRTNELESLTAEVMVNGQKIRMTRNQIEENLKSIKEQIFNIEENTLEPAQHRVDLAQQQLDKEVAGITILGQTKDQWDLIGIEIDAAKTSTTAYLAELENALAVAKQIPAALAGQVSQEDFDKNPAIKSKPYVAPGPGGGTTPTKTTTQKQEQAATSRADTSLVDKYGTSPNPPSPQEIRSYQSDRKIMSDYYAGKGGFTTEWALNDAINNSKKFEQSYGIVDRRTGYRWDNPKSTPSPFAGTGRVFSTGPTNSTGYGIGPSGFASGGLVMPKYFAAGGFARGTDTVPAILSPGEFIVSKYGVDNYGVDNLKAINNGTAGANSVYNGYNINVNVRSNSNPDQIANAVMTQIRQINAQQVRGSKF